MPSLGPIDDPEEQELEFHSKDFRLRIARRKAVAEIKTIKSPKTEKELKAKMKRVATVVAGTLNTSPAVALSAYIDPSAWEQWESISAPSRKSTNYSAVAAKAEKVEKLLAELFRARWRAVEADFANGIDVAEARARSFLASDARTRLRIARRRYNPTRATKFAGASISEIVWLCRAWFTPFQLYVYSSGNELSEIGDHLEKLVRSEYVAMTWGLLSTPPGCDAYMDPSFPEIVEEVCCYDSPHVYPLADLTTRFGDVYEAIVYSYFGERLRVCKSISEPFLEAERADAMAEIERAFLQNACEVGDDARTWSLKFRGLTTSLLPKYGRAWRPRLTSSAMWEVQGRKRISGCLKKNSRLTAIVISQCSRVRLIDSSFYVERPRTAGSDHIFMTEAKIGMIETEVLGLHLPLVVDLTKRNSGGDLRFVVKRGKTLGTLILGRGSVEWWAGKAKKPTGRWSWTQFSNLLNSK